MIKSKGAGFGRLTLAAVLALAALGQSGQAQEQAAPQTPPRDTGAAAALEDIVVTAQRRGERLQDVPIQVAAFSSETIENAGITSTQDFVSLVPNVSLDESFSYLNSFVVVRGVTQINNADSPIAVIVDGVPQNNQKQFRMNLFDVERIEVLKGPQGGLYGRNAIGGAVNIVTKAPGDEFEGSVASSYGRGDAFNVTGIVSTPLGDNAGLRVTGNYMTDNGRIKNSYTGKNVDFVDHDWEVRGRFTADLSDTLDVDLRAAYRDFQAGSIYDSVVLSGRANDYQAPQESLEGLTFGNIFDASAKFELDLSGVTLSSITGYTRLREDYRGDIDFSNPVDKPDGFLGLGFQAGQGQDLVVKTISQELRLVSDGSGPFRWILGSFYLNTKRDLATRVFIDVDGSRDQIDDPDLGIVGLLESNNNNAYAVYASFDYDLLHNLTLSGALRYDQDDRKQRDLVSGNVRKVSFNSVQPKATLTYKLDNQRLVYATYSTGFRSGGFNAPTVSIPIYRPEELENFELGFKTSWLDRKLILNGAIYKAKDKDFQFFYFDIATASQIISNIERVDIWGVELEAQAKISRELQLFTGIGTTDSTIKRNVAFPDTVGKKTPKSTSWSLNAGFQYETQLTDTLDLLIRGDYAHKGKKYWQIDNLDVQRPTDIVDFRVGVRNDRWELFLSGNNNFGEKYYTDFNPTSFSGLDVALGFPAQPASWSIDGKLRF